MESSVTAKEEFGLITSEDLLSVTLSLPEKGFRLFRGCRNLEVESFVTIDDSWSDSFSELDWLEVCEARGGNGKRRVLTIWFDGFEGGTKSVG